MEASTWKVKANVLTQAQRVFVGYHFPQQLKFTNHALVRQNERCFRLSLAEYAHHCTISNLVEVQVDADRVKFLFRVALNKAFHLCFVVSAAGNIVTAYLNRPNDTHEMQDPNLYRTKVTNDALEQLFHEGVNVAC